MKPISDALIQDVGSDDPWIKAYLLFAQKLERGEFATKAQVTEYVADARRGLANTEPGYPSRVFITADISMRFPAPQSLVPNAASVAMMTGLWVPK